MEIFDYKFDGPNGDANVNLANGTLEIKITEKNPLLPSDLQINIPLDDIFAKLEAQAPNLLIKWGEKAAQAMIDGID